MDKPEYHLHETHSAAIDMEALLGRSPAQLNLGQLHGFLAGKTVLISGGGGSIGSELCRQIVRYHPARLVIVDIYENNAYDIQQELLMSSPSGTDICVEIASIRDRRRIHAIFAQYRPHLVFHAAAHKHVPLMEACPAEAVKNNIFGTLNMVEAAESTGSEKFVMISTDKAVNPTNVMGATKRFCEMLLQSRTDSPTEFCAVRFGNVLGSNGSVVPLFLRQIEAGGPVTITDRRIIRYFMTISEAAHLVLEAGAMAQQSQIFVLDMGDPVKILDLAEKLIRLSGFEPYRDIEIREVGLRPGEKLYEELLTGSADLLHTENRKIFIERPEQISRDLIDDALRQLKEVTTAQMAAQNVIRLLHRLVPSYRTPDEVNSLI
ncbi:MAG: polysaccharide biosynthesis protein [Clostridia bacterium]|nr:polysaccharide biosynthesis protein [Clostridia bacterium]